MAIAPLKVLFFRTFSGVIATFCYFSLWGIMFDDESILRQNL